VVFGQGGIMAPLTGHFETWLSNIQNPFVDLRSFVQQFYTFFQDDI
jgi:hypothetical protein